MVQRTWLTLRLQIQQVHRSNVQTPKQSGTTLHTSNDAQQSWNDQVVAARSWTRSPHMFWFHVEKEEVFMFLTGRSNTKQRGFSIKISLGKRDDIDIELFQQLNVCYSLL